MVCLATMNKFRDYQRDNEERFYREHRGETCLLEFGKNGKITEKFFSNGDEAQTEVRKYDHLIGKFGTLPYSIFGIPEYTHKFDEGFTIDVSFQEGVLPERAESIEDIILMGDKKTSKFKPMFQMRPDERVETCIHDGKTKLKKLYITGGTDGYQETAMCPDCGYQVVRKPLDKDVKKLEENAKKMIFK